MTGFPTFSSEPGLPGRDDAWEPTILNLRRPDSATPPQSGLLTSPSLLSPPPLPAGLQPAGLQPASSLRASVAADVSPPVVMRLPDVAALTQPVSRAWYTYLAPIVQWLAIGLGALLALYLIFGGHRTPVRTPEDAPPWNVPQPSAPAAPLYEPMPQTNPAPSAPPPGQQMPAAVPAPMIPPSAPLYEHEPVPGDNQPAVSPGTAPAFEIPHTDAAARRGVSAPAERLRTAQLPESPDHAADDDARHEPQSLGITPIAVPQ